MRDTKLSSIVRVRNSPNGSVYKEIIVTFRDPGERDYYFSRARNLAAYRAEDGSPTAGIRIDVPPFLMSSFKLLNDHGHEIRRAHGSETRRYIKFDEDNLSLVLEVRLPGQQKWTRIKPQQARQFCDEKDKIEYLSIRRGLMREPQCNANPNLIPIGSSRPATQSRGIGQVTGPPRRTAWVPPPRSSPTPENRS